MAKGMWIGANGAVTLKNLLDGGKFKDTIYWTASKATYTVSGFVATVTSTGTWACLYKDLAITSGHIYYSRVRVKYSTSTSHNGALLSFKPTSNAGGSSTATARASKYDGTWQSISIRTTVNYSDLRVHLYQPYTGSGTAMKDFTVQWNQPLLIDLTACFGAGKEPTKEWCDSNISFFDSTTTANNPNVSGVARRVKNWWIGVDSAGYRSLYNVPMYDKINIGGDIFTVIGHDVATKYTALSGKGSLLWHDEPEVTSPVSWTERGATSAINDTITSMAKSTSSAKFKILNYQCFKYHLSQKESVRYYNGTAVSHWAAGARTDYEYVLKRYDASGNYIDGGYYNWGSTDFHWVKADGSSGGYSDDSTISDHESSPPGNVEGSIPSSIKHYYYYACEVDGNTKVTYNANTGYWELFS